jgi:hypothetical protein
MARSPRRSVAVITPMTFAVVHHKKQPHAAVIRLVRARGAPVGGSSPA